MPLGLPCQNCEPFSCLYQKAVVNQDGISVLRNYGEKSTAYYVRCQDCTDRFASDRRWARQWEEEFADTARQLEAFEA